MSKFLKYLHGRIILGDETNDPVDLRGAEVPVSSHAKRGVRQDRAFKHSGSRPCAFYSAFPHAESGRLDEHDARSAANLWLGRLTTGSDRFPHDTYGDVARAL